MTPSSNTNTDTKPSNLSITDMQDVLIGADTELASIAESIYDYIISTRFEYDSDKEGTDNTNTDVNYRTTEKSIQQLVSCFAMSEANYKKSKAASNMGLDRGTLYRYINTKT